jgi:4-hydroxy-3-methylbut-2-enyl diphosphate reductase
VNSAEELPADLSGSVAVTAGASAPESLVEAVVDRLQPHSGVHVNPVTIEDEYFPPPPELREILRSLEIVAKAVFTGEISGEDVTVRDRDFAAADVLAH